MTEQERTYHGKRDIKYLFLEGAKDSPYLIVIFQAIPSAKNNFQKVYGYKKTLNKLNCHRLYIQDTYGLLGCFYMCENMDFSIEDSTVALIRHIMKKYGISKRHVITCGSSKGGACALYFGAKYGFGHAVCGAPPTRIGSIICSISKETAKFMMGEDLPQENIDYLDENILKHIVKGLKTDVRILTSVHDKQYPRHIVPLMEKRDELNLPIDIKLDDRIKCHHDIAKYFQAFMINNIFDIILRDLNREKPVVTVNRDGLTIEGAGNRGDGVSFRVRIVDSKEEVLYQEEIENDHYEFKVDEIVSGLVYLDLSIDGEEWMNYRVTEAVFDQGYFRYNGYEVDVDREKKTIKIKINIDEAHDKLTYAYNLSLNKKKITPTLSSSSNEYVFNIEESGDYRVTFAIRMKNAGKISNRTHVISVDFEDTDDEE